MEKNRIFGFCQQTNKQTKKMDDISTQIVPKNVIIILIIRFDKQNLWNLTFFFTN